MQFQNYKYYFEVSIVVLTTLHTSMVPVLVVLFTVSQSASRIRVTTVSRVAEYRLDLKYKNSLYNNPPNSIRKISIITHTTYI